MIRHQRICDVVNPPLPTSSTASFDAISGQKLLSLLKTYDKCKPQTLRQPLKDTDDKDYSFDDDDDDNNAGKVGAVVEEIIHALQQLTIIAQRQGLLCRSNNTNGNTAMAKQVLDSMSMNKQQQHTSSTGKKKRKVNHQPTQQLLIDETLGYGGILDNATTSNTTTATSDVQLLMMAIIRIIENYHHCDTDRWIFTTTTDLITASCQFNMIQQQFMHRNGHLNLCFLAEYELIASSCKSFVNGIEQYIRHQYNGQESAPMNKDIDLQQDLHNYSLVSSFRAVTSIIGLLGNKLFTTRNSNTNTITTILHKLQELAWQAMVNDCFMTTYSNSFVQIQSAAITFVTTLSCAAATVVATTNTNMDNGNQNRINTCMMWNQTWMDAICALSTTMQHLSVEKSSSGKRKEFIDDTSIGKMSVIVKQIILDQWIPSLRNMNDNNEETRVTQVLQTVKSLASILMRLLTKEGIPSSLGSSVNGEINVDLLLTIIDNMLSLPSISENKYYSTKKRLRNESMTTGSGLSFSFSPLCLVTKIAMPIQLIGYELLQATVTSLGSMNLLPFVRRIIKIIYQTVLSSASNTVRHTIDPTNMMFGWNSNNKRGERWLHTSIISRTASIQSFQCCIETFGVDVQQVSSNANNRNSNNRNSHVESSIRLICATMIEELSLKNSSESNDSDHDWGTWNDRLKLIHTIATCLTACLNCGGSFLALTIRDLMDMVVATSLSSIVHDHPITEFGDVKCSIIQLGIAAVCTPWQDGAASTIASELMSAAQSCVQDSNVEVVASATAALNVCHALHCSRIPPLHVITRSNNFLSDNTSSSTAINAQTIEDKLRSTSDEINRSKAISDVKTKATNKSKPDPTSTEIHLKRASSELTTTNTTTIIQSLPFRDDAKESQVGNDAVAPMKLKHEYLVDPIDTKENEPSSLLLDHSANTEDEDLPMIVDCGPDEDDE